MGSGLIKFEGCLLGMPLWVAPRNMRDKCPAPPKRTQFEGCWTKLRGAARDALTPRKTSQYKLDSLAAIVPWLWYVWKVGLDFSPSSERKEENIMDRPQKLIVKSSFPLKNLDMSCFLNVWSCWTCQFTVVTISANFVVVTINRTISTTSYILGVLGYSIGNMLFVLWSTSNLIILASE